MATEVLYVEESNLQQVIDVIRAGLASPLSVTPDVREMLEDWCNSEQTYLESEDDWQTYIEPDDWDDDPA